jgi:DNA-directed RNA polymerase specialized sigma subunit, sigma24 homolog
MKDFLNNTNSDFYQCIQKCQNKDQNEMILMIMKFRPLIKKYSYLLNYCDAEQDITLAFIEILEQIPIQRINKERANIIILSYIEKSIKNKYIYLSKNKNIGYVQEELTEESCACNDPDADVSIIKLEGLEQLTVLQKKVITLKYYYGYSDIEISQILKTTRQSVNRTKLRALEKLRQYMLEL